MSPLMKPLLMLFAMLALCQARAQTTNSRVAGVIRRGNITSPEVNPDRTVTFRLRAPEAKEIKVGGEWPGGQTALTNQDGLWSATVGPLEPDIYGYSLTIDGVSLVDPGNPWVKPMRAARTSVLEVPGDPPRLWEFQPVPHGTVHEHVYFSKSLNARRRLHVYTPPGYEKDSKSYPVLYLFHGSGDNDATWTDTGRAQFISDNLLAQNKTRPMILIMTDGHAVTGNPTQVGPELINRNVESFSNDVLKDVMPLVDSLYRTKPGRDNRAVIGLSMGGGQSLSLGLRHRDQFAWVGGMSSFLPNPEKIVTEAFPDSKSDLKTLWFACGKDDRLVENARELASALKAKGIPHQFVETAGNHSWPVWRRYLGDFMPLLFADSKASQ
jgi:enterochelin esterase-like enzyme